MNQPEDTRSARAFDEWKRIGEIEKFLRYWHSHPEFWPLVREQLHIIATEAASGKMSDAARYLREQLVSARSSTACGETPKTDALRGKLDNIFDANSAEYKAINELLLSHGALELAQWLPCTDAKEAQEGCFRALKAERELKTALSAIEEKK